MHRLLERQLRKAFGAGQAPAGLDGLLAAVDAAYIAADEDRALLERSMDLASGELQAGNRALREHIEELQVVQRRLAQSEAAYRRIMLTASEGIWTLGADGRIDFVNDTMCEALGYERDELLGRLPTDFVDEPHGGDTARRLAQPLQGPSARFEFSMRRKDGSLAWMLVSASPITDDDGQAVGALGMFADITGRKLAEDGLRQAFSKLQRADTARQAFINAAAHELGTPLTPIRLQVHAMKRRATGELANSVLVLERNVDRIILLVNDLLDSAKIQTDRLALQTETLDLVVLARAAATSFADVAEHAGLTLEVEGDGMLPVFADRRRLEQVFDNLLVNAAKFTPRGGRIRVRTGRDGDMAWFEVTDTGIGLDRDGLSRLFQPFTQVHDPSTAPPGTGLGLYICLGIMEALGGALTADSRGLGRGASFRAALPLAEAAHEPKRRGPRMV